MNSRGKWQGALTIARLNWPFYAAAAATLIAALWLLPNASSPRMMAAAMVTASGAAYFLVVSLAVSHLVYDRSDLYRWRWLERALPEAPLRDAIFCHSGFDEASEPLRRRLPDVHWRILDHYEAQRMTEPSIQRARALFPPAPGTLAAPFDCWPVETQSADAVFGLLAIHELRSRSERAAWFAEARRCLRPGGRILLVEHVRDLANFVAFGPGFLHFHSPENWRKCWELADLRLLNQLRITPWVRVFVLAAS